MFLATSSIFWWWTLRNLVISDHIILEKKASMIGIFVCSWCCFFPICKYLETFKRFVEEEHFHWHVDEDIHWNFLIQPIPLFQMPAYVCLFRLIIISCYYFLFSFLLIFLYFLKLVSMKICAMWACKLFLHQNGLKGRIWF